MGYVTCIIMTTGWSIKFEAGAAGLWILEADQPLSCGLQGEFD
jgi:hypothetical protein